MKKRVIDVLEKAEAIAWDTCHKIYILMDKGQVEKMIEYGYKDDMLTKADINAEQMFNTIQDWYANSCSLRFIQSVRTVDPNEGFEDVVPQGKVWF